MFCLYCRGFNKYRIVTSPLPLPLVMKNYVCRFAQHWEDFRLPELDAVAKIQGVSVSYEPSDYTNEVRSLFSCYLCVCVC